jgi:hypothetical protein
VKLPGLEYWLTFQKEHKKQKPRHTWIKVEGAEYELTKDEIMAWLENKERVTLPTRMNISTASIQLR